MNLVVSFFVDSDQDFNNNRDNFKFISWSPYDRISIKEVNTFRELCVCDYEKNFKNPAKWIGVEQRMHLIGKPQSECKWNFSNSDENILISTNDGVKYDFYCILSIRYANSLLRSLNYSDKKVDSLDKVIKKINKILDSYSEISYAEFDSLGSEDMVVILLSNSVSSIIKAVNDLVSIKCILGNNEGEEEKNIDLFYNICTFFGLNNLKCKRTNDVDIIVRLGLKNQNSDDVLSYICKDESISSSYKLDSRGLFRGKSTLELFFPCNTINFSAFSNGGIFNGSSDFYSENIGSSRTSFINCFDASNTEPIDFKNILFQAKKENNYKIENIYIDCDSRVASFLSSEYNRMLQSPRFESWHEILLSQYKSMQSFVKSYNKQDKRLGSELLNSLQSSLLHIGQACSPIYEVPFHNYFYSGSFNDLLKIYYSIIQLLLDIAYNLPHADGTKQHKISFCVCLDSTIRIESKMFIKEQDNDRFVVFYIPYESFWDYSSNIRFLIHEVFHYVAPFDRKERGKHLLNLIFFQILNYYFNHVFKDITDNDLIIEHNLWIGYIIEQYNENAREKFYLQIEKQLWNYFNLSNPEWSNMFFNNNVLDEIIIEVCDIISEMVIENFDDACGYIVKKNTNASNKKECNIKKIYSKKKILQIFSRENILTTLNMEQLYSDIRNEIKSAKEAFCDLWALSILDISIPEYIIYIFKSLKHTVGNDLLNAAVQNATNSITPESLMLRCSLLMDQFFSTFNDIDENGVNEVFDESFEELVKRDFELAHIIIEFKKKYMHHISIAPFRKSELSYIAFYNLNNIFKNMSNFKEAIKLLRNLYSHNLSENVFYDDFNSFTNNLILAGKVLKPEPIVNYTQEIRSTIRSISNDYRAVYVYNIDEYIKYVCSIVDSSGKGNILWFRGVCNKKYGLLPSLFRNCDDSLSLYTNQANIIKHAYLQTRGIEDLWDMSIEQQMACLQHYGMSTNLLDFSLDMLVSLYFSITPDNPKDRENIDNGKFRPVVYIFDPIAYSNAIATLRRGHGINNLYNIIPYTFDIENNPTERSKYFVTSSSFESLVSHTIKYNEPYSPCHRTNDYPIPMIIRNSNPRIIAQSGTFVTFSLDALPEMSKEGDNRYEYLDLINIQNEYNRFANDHPLSYQRKFLYRINIAPAAIPTIRSDLEKLHIAKYRVYPELKEVLSEAMNQYKNSVNNRSYFT